MGLLAVSAGLGTVSSEAGAAALTVDSLFESDCWKELKVTIKIKPELLFGGGGVKPV